MPDSSESPTDRFWSNADTATATAKRPVEWHLRRAGALHADLPDTIRIHRLTAWYAPAPSGRPTVVLFPGKSASLRGQRYRLRHFIDARMGVLLLAWRGYSGNPGKPDEHGLYADATAALAWLCAHGVVGDAIVLYGISLGSGVATRMATDQDHAAVILEAPYTSVADVAALRFPWVPVRWLLRDRFDSLERMPALSKPLLVMHGDSDTVIPQRLGIALFEAATVPKAGFWPHGIGHADLFDHGGFDAAVAFIERSVQSPVLERPAAHRSCRSD